ncbi:MAG TPA: hypothetical protein VGV15_15950 [Terriglobales bacterium]|nr:hypothetical protein [Terriglobales bacterium]
MILQSDDWGRVGVRDREGYEQLRANGIRLGQHPYDFYTLETAKDVTAISDLLKRHRDRTGRPACLVMNFILANLNFAKTEQAGFRELHLLPLTRGLPGHWKRPGLFDAYKQGIADGVFFPALHGLTHFCRRAVEHALSENAERSALLKTCWKAETPYIYWRMPWVGYEYCNPEKPHAGFLDSESQASLIQQAAAYFKKLFSAAPVSACAPGYRANHDTHAAWSACGVRVAQNGSGTPLPPYMDDWEILNLHRMIDFEPAQRELPTEKYVEVAADCFARGIPAVISVHSINFHSSVRDFRGPTLRALDQLLSALETKYPNLLYVHDGDLYDIVSQGKYRAMHRAVSVGVKQMELAKSAARGAH